jgi:hypothetical protein
VAKEEVGMEDLEEEEVEGVSMEDKVWVVSVVVGVEVLKVEGIFNRRFINLCLH